MSRDVIRKSLQLRFVNEFIPHNPRVLNHLVKVALLYFRRARWHGSSTDTLDRNSGLAPGLKECGIYVPNAPKPQQSLVTVFGHATSLLRFHNFTVLIDPVWSKNAGPFGKFGPRRKNYIADIEVVQKPDVILISHDHYDHLDLSAVRWFTELFSPIIITGVGVGSLIRRTIPQAQVIELGWWESCKVKVHEFTFVPAQHFSGRTLRFNRTLWGGFVGRIHAKHFYYVGDSGYQPQIIERIKERFPRIDLGLIPIGSYEPYEYLKHYHLSPHDALNLQEALDIPLAIAVHFGTFQLSLENGLKQVTDFLQLRTARADRSRAFILPTFGHDYQLEW